MDQKSNRMNDIERLKSEHRVLALLRFLGRQPCAASNDAIIAALFDYVGLSCSRQELRACLDHAEATGLIAVRQVDSLLVVGLTARGEEVSLGKISVDGVLRPGVDCPY